MKKINHIKEKIIRFITISFYKGKRDSVHYRLMSYSGLQVGGMFYPYNYNTSIHLNGPKAPNYKITCVHYGIPFWAGKKLTDMYNKLVPKN